MAVGSSRQGDGVVGMLLLLAACGPIVGGKAGPKEHVRGEQHRLIHESVERLWPRVVGALEDDGVHVVRADRAHGAIETGAVRHAERDVVKRLRDVADLSEARAAGLGNVTEFRVKYHVFLNPVGTDTSVKITSAIEAVDAGNTALLGGVLQVIPHHIDVPSRGVLERELLRHVAASLFSAEEMLFVLGEPGVD